ncbi:MAG: hypothetical protein IJ569_06815 [Prevotella sp.]|nr:hypothetical protein [Prevotella sp.]
MVLHVFNPEHDLALAANLSNFTAPHAGRQLHGNLCWIPAIWAKAGELVLVDDVEEAQTAYRRLLHCCFDGFVEKRQLERLDIDHVKSWGWDLALRAFLLRYGVKPEACATEADIATIRELSHRRTAVSVLSRIQREGTTGESMLACSIPEIVELRQRWGKIVVKAPWSSSGRGIRFIGGEIDSYQNGWLQNVIRRQGSVVVEPFYNKVKDFAMEFEIDESGKISCLGLSLFHTSNGAYTGNILAHEEEKREMISRYVSTELLDAVQQDIILSAGDIFQGNYKGPFGVDMMIVARPDGNGFLLHPCVEINLRRTMGHVALSLTGKGVMQVTYTDNHYKLKIIKV